MLDLLSQNKGKKNLSNQLNTRGNPPLADRELCVPRRRRRPGEAEILVPRCRGRGRRDATSRLIHGTTGCRLAIQYNELWRKFVLKCPGGLTR